MARLLTSLGIPCGHESIFTPHGIEYAKEIINGAKDPKLSVVSLEDNEKRWVNTSNIVAESSYLAAPFLSSELLSTNVIHIVRHPLDVMSSFIYNFDYFRFSSPPSWDEYQQFIYQNLECLTQGGIDQITRAALFYVEWNNMIEKNDKVIFRYKVESNVDVLANKLNVKKDKIYQNRFCNHKNKYAKLRWGQIPKSQIKNKLAEIADRYSYQVEIL